MSGRREVWEDDPKSEPVLSFHDTPNYDSDPGTGVAFHIEGGEVWVLLFWDGANRMIVAFPRDEFLAALKSNTEGRSE